MSYVGSNIKTRTKQKRNMMMMDGQLILAIRQLLDLEAILDSPLNRGDKRLLSGKSSQRLRHKNRHKILS